MNVADRMTKNPFSVTPESSVSDARELMKRENVRRLPVVNDRGELMGIVTEKDILCASPSPASTGASGPAEDLRCDDSPADFRCSGYAGGAGGPADRGSSYRRTADNRGNASHGDYH